MPTMQAVNQYSDLVRRTKAPEVRKFLEFVLDHRPNILSAFADASEEQATSARSKAASTGGKPSKNAQ